MTLSAKVSTKHQISLPSEARRALGIQPGDRLSVVVRDDELILRLRPARASERLLGIAKGSYGPDPQTYLRALRAEMEDAVDERQRLAGREPRRSTSPDRA
jgi:AbrB family looped-hinge helix DNA binding protein